MSSLAVHRLSRQVQGEHTGSGIDARAGRRRSNTSLSWRKKVQLKSTRVVPVHKEKRTVRHPWNVRDLDGLSDATFRSGNHKLARRHPLRGTGLLRIRTEATPGPTIDPDITGRPNLRVIHADRVLQDKEGVRNACTCGSGRLWGRTFSDLYPASCTLRSAGYGSFHVSEKGLFL